MSKTKIIYSICTLLGIYDGGCLQQNQVETQPSGHDHQEASDILLLCAYQLQAAVLH